MTVLNILRIKQVMKNLMWSKLNLQVTGIQYNLDMGALGSCLGAPQTYCLMLIYVCLYTSSFFNV